MYGVSSEVVVLEFDPNHRIRMQWGVNDPTLIEWTFGEIGPEKTFVAIRNWGFAGSQDEQVAAALDSTGGFCWVWQEPRPGWSMESN